MSFSFLLMAIPFFLTPSWITVFGKGRRPFTIVAANVTLISLVIIALIFVTDFNPGIQRAVVRMQILAFGIVPVSLLAWLVLLRLSIYWNATGVEIDTKLVVNRAASQETTSAPAQNTHTQSPYTAPRTDPKPRQYRRVVAAQWLAIVVTAFAWLLPLVLMMAASVDPTAALFWGYCLIMLSLAMAASERYLENAQAGAVSNHAPLAYGLLALNMLPIVVAVLVGAYRVALNFAG